MPVKTRTSHGTTRFASRGAPVLLVNRTDPSFKPNRSEVRYLAKRLTKTLNLPRRKLEARIGSPEHEFEFAFVGDPAASPVSLSDAPGPVGSGLCLITGRRLVYHMAFGMRDGDLWETVATNIVERWLTTMPEGELS